MLIIGTTSFGQIKVWNNNKVAVGPSYGAPSETLNINGPTYFSCTPALSGISISNSTWTGSNLPSINAQWGNSCLIGSSTIPFWRIYSNQLYSLSGAVIAYSDVRLKENIRPLISSEALTKVLAINAYTYDYKSSLFANDSSENRSKLIADSKNKVGLMAQEVQQVLPQAVTIDEQTGYYNLNYIAIIPLLLEAIKAQQQQIQALEQQIITLTK